MKFSTLLLDNGVVIFNTIFETDSIDGDSESHEAVVEFWDILDDWEAEEES